MPLYLIPVFAKGFFIALRLVAACQCGRDVALSSIQMSDPPPKFVGVDQTVWTIDVSIILCGIIKQSCWHVDTVSSLNI